MARFATKGAFDGDLSVDNRELVSMLERLVYQEIVKTNDIRKVFRKVMTPVRKAAQAGAKAAIPNDPREAWRAVRVITLKKGAGAVAGLLNPYSVSTMRLFAKPKGGKSGIIRKRAISKHTRQTESYYGKDRAFILRILNQGTEERKAGTRGTLKKEANRGTITAKKFFRCVEQPMKQAEQELAKELGAIIEKATKK